MNYARFSNPLSPRVEHAQEIVSYLKRGAEPFELCLKFPDLSQGQCDRIFETVVRRRGRAPIVESVRRVEHILSAR